MAELKIKAEKRKLFGRKVKKLRVEGILPANIYGKGLKSQAVKVGIKDFLAVYKETGETGIVKLSLAKEIKTRPVLIHNLQKDPVTDEPLHADFHQIDLKEKVQVDIPIELIGEAPAITKGGVLVQLMSEIEVEALPTDLPDKFELSISKIIEIGQSISIKGLKVDKKKIKILVDESQLIVKVEEPKKEEEKPAEEVPTEEKEAKEDTEVKESPVEAKEGQEEKKKGGKGEKKAGAKAEEKKS